MEEQLTHEERTLLLKIARQAIEAVVGGKKVPILNLQDLPIALTEPGATFVTLTLFGELKGCIGTLEAIQPLAFDVQERAIAAALEDFRFAPVQPGEVANLKIEISRLTSPQPLDYDDPSELPKKLHPMVDGVVIRDGLRRATFLPQVWEKIPQPDQFLDHLCMKMGLPPDHWRSKRLEVNIYQVEEFHE
jgi:AmmeMemoRadiSam system protein A